MVKSPALRPYLNVATTSGVAQRMIKIDKSGEIIKLASHKTAHKAAEIARFLIMIFILLLSRLWRLEAKQS